MYVFKSGQTVQSVPTNQSSYLNFNKQIQALEKRKIKDKERYQTLFSLAYEKGGIVSSNCSTELQDFPKNQVKKN